MRTVAYFLGWCEQDVEKTGAIAIDFIGLTFLEWILCPTSELSHLLVCSAWDRIFALGVGVGKEGSSRSLATLSWLWMWNSNMGGIRNACGCCFLGRIMLSLTCVWPKTKNVFLAVWPWPKTQKCLFECVHLECCFHYSNSRRGWRVGHGSSVIDFSFYFV